MSYAARFRPEVSEDAADAFAWYESRGAGLGHDFLRAFYAAAARAERNPLLFKRVHADFRRVLLRRFPYKLYFRIHEETVVFYLLFHGARRPEAFRRSLRERKD